MIDAGRGLEIEFFGSDGCHFYIEDLRLDYYLTDLEAFSIGFYSSSIDASVGVCLISRIALLHE